MGPSTRTRRLGVLVAVLVLAGLVGGDLAVSDRLLVVAAFGVAPLLAAVLATTSETAVVATLAVGAATAVGWSARGHGAEWAVRVAVCAVVSGLAVALTELRTRRDRQLQHMSRIARAAQLALVRTVPVGLGDLWFAARYLSATSEALIGGDLYDVGDTSYGTRLIVADVRGKGIEAVQLAAGVLAGFRQAALVEPDLARVAAHLDELVRGLGGEEDFVTAVLAEFPGDGTVGLVSCGHHPPLLLGSGVTTLDTGDPALPLGLGTAPGVTRHRLPVGARLLFYTDGLVEARDRDGAFFALAAHLEELHGGSLDRCLDALVDRLRAHTGTGVDDDLAALLVEYRPVPPAATAPPSRSGRRLPVPRSPRPRVADGGEATVTAPR